MHRRNFLKNGSVVGAVFSTSLKSIAAAYDGADNIGGKLANSDFAFNEATIDGLQQQMVAGTTNSVAIVDAYLARIQKLDKAGPTLNAIIEINPDALSIAGALDAERKAGKIRGPLHGIPVLIKDNINTGDKMMTTAGSLALNGNIASRDAFIVQKLREAGAVLLGKTNLSEWANFRSERSTSGWSSRGGQTRCAYVLDRNPSGSSAGSGVASAANLCTLSIGTETDGSIVSPASVNGIVGIKPTVGLWSRSGIIPISATQDTAGPMARTVRDAAILLGALAGQDPADIITFDSANKLFKDYTVFLDKNGLSGRRIGIEKSHLKGNDAVVAVFRDAIHTMEHLGAEVIEIDLLSTLKEARGGEFEVLCFEFKDGVNRYLAGAEARVKTLQDVIEFNRQHEKEAMPYFKQETLVDCQAKGDLRSRQYGDALMKSLSSRKIISDLMTQNRLDAMCGVTNGPACCIDLVNGDYDTGNSISTPAAISGYPHITVPMGLVLGLPVGISFFATAYAEPRLLGIAYAYEQVSMKRTAPAFLPSTPNPEVAIK